MRPGDGTRLASLGRSDEPTLEQLAKLRRVVMRRYELGKDDPQECRDILGMLDLVDPKRLHPDAPFVRGPDNLGRRGRGPGEDRARAERGAP